MENYTYENNDNITMQNTPPTNNTNKRIAIIAVVVAVLLCVGFLVFIFIYNIQKEELKKNLTGARWFWINDGFTIYLDFDDNKVEYSGDYGILGNIVFLDIEYEVTGPNTIRLIEYYDNGDDMIVNVVYSDLGTSESLKCTPSIINTKESSLWAR